MIDLSKPLEVYQTDGGLQIEVAWASSYEFIMTLLLDNDSWPVIAAGKIESEVVERSTVSLYDVQLIELRLAGDNIEKVYNQYVEFGQPVNEKTIQDFRKFISNTNKF